MNQLEHTIRELIEDGLADSAEKMCSVLLQSDMCVYEGRDAYTGHRQKQRDRGGNRDSDSRRGPHERIRELHGDALFALEEYSRALDAYRRAASAACVSSTNNETPVETQTHARPVLDSIDARLVFKQCKCMVKMDESAAVIREMERIPKEFRTVRMNVFLGNLYKTAKLRRHAVSTLQEVVTANPLAVECIEALVDLGVEVHDIIRDGASNAAEGEEDVVESFRKAWVPQLTNALCLQYNSDYEGCKAHLQPLLSRYPGSVYLTTQLALCAHNAEEPEEAIRLFRCVRQADKGYSMGMGIFAQLLYYNHTHPGDRVGSYKGYDEELSRLATDLLTENPKVSAGWVAAALYTELRGDKDKSLAFVEKGCRMGARTPIPFVAKGNLFLSRGQPESASIAFSQAMSLDKRNVDALFGMVESCLKLGKYKDAMLGAKSALKLRSNSSVCFTLLGRVISKSDSETGRKEAAKAFKKALKLNPRNDMAACELGELLLAEGQNEEAASILKQVIDIKPTYNLRCLYGKVLGKMNNHDAAIDQLHSAMSSDQTGLADEHNMAMHEMDSVESHMRGEDMDESASSSGYYDTTLRNMQSPSEMDMPRYMHS